VFVLQINVQFFYLLEEGDEKWPHFLHNFKGEKIASGIQLVGKGRLRL